jgi:NAD+ kinase
MMAKIAVIYKRNESLAAQLGLEMKHWLEERGVEVYLRENVARHLPGEAAEEPPLCIPPESIAVAVLGGDGTFLSVARLVGDLPVPLLGVNIGGGMGFLTEVNLRDRYVLLEEILARRYQVEERMRLRAALTRGGETVAHMTVLNDVAINKAALARIIELEVSIDGCYFTTYRADGLIVSTPTGSTAYNLAAGGPIVFPTARAIILTPICSFSLTNRPLVLPGTARVEMKVRTKGMETTLTGDGQVGEQVLPGDVVTMEQAPHPQRLIKCRQEDYFSILRNKLKYGEV